MKYFEKFKWWKFSKSRTEAFSDGVFAIIITLLILEIKMPHLEDHTDSKQFLMALGVLAPKIISWAVSFFFISVMWVQHHNVFRMAEKIDYGIVWINNLFLLFLCFLQSQAPGYRKTAFHRIMSAKKEETKLRRLEVLMQDSAEGRKIRPLSYNVKK